MIDQGIGISEDYLSTSGEPAYSNKEKGIGLGLMLTSKIVEQHNGKITVQSKIGHGTIFTINLPI
ncbi:ATP-binding protein [Alteribacillus sp. JSM 102045]|uniref:ATP-binding protein n=1 Tax=Alteribacillus sp. JSM 102045 TaxID=1562101 RepID=UPI0035BF72D6